MKRMFALLAAAWMLASCGNAPANKQVLESKILENGGTGPYKAFVISDSAFDGYAVYRPENLKAAVRKEGKLPVIVFGNGGCRNSSVEFQKYLNEIASYGYVAVAIGPLSFKSVEETNSAFTGMTDASLLNKAMDLMVAQAADPESDYYGMVDVDKICAMGQSCGGLQALTASVDSRVKTSVILNSGIFKEDGRPMGGMPDLSNINLDSLRASLPEEIKKLFMNEDGSVKEEFLNMEMPAMPAMPSGGGAMGGTMGKDGLKKLHAPLVYLIGGESDIAYENALDDFRKIDNVPVSFANLPVGHLGTYQDDFGGQFAQVALKWLDWQLKGRDASAFFSGKDISEFPEWTVVSKNF